MTITKLSSGRTPAAQPHPAGPRHLRPATQSSFLFGVAYYPEHYPRRRWKRDLALMREHGVQAVRMGEFAWDVWEPREGEYSFSLFDDVIGLIAEHGIQVVLGTPTAGPPSWLSANHPEWLKRTRDGLLIGHTGRMHGTPVHDGFRAASTRLVQAMAEHYAPNPAVVGWQIDNEFHCICPLDFSDEAERQFRGWLRERYGRIATLNTRWGMRFSAQTFGSFEEVPLPLRCRPDRFPPQPGHLLDFARFMSDATIRLAGEQVAALRQANAHWLIFHNGLFAHLDYWKLAASLDCLGVDLYPAFGGTGLPQRAWTAFKLEQCRAHSGSFVVPELATGAVGSCEHVLETPEPGEMRLWAWQCVAHGADGVFHFQWRTARFGQELYWHGVLAHDGQPGRRLKELGVEGREFARIGRKLLGTVREVRIGILIDWEQDDNQEAILASHYPAPRHQAEQLLGALLERHLPVGLVHASDDWTGLEALIIPSFGSINAERAKRLEVFARQGGVVLATAGTGRRDDCVQALMTKGPGPLARLFGAVVIEVGAFRNEPVIELQPADAPRLTAAVGYEILQARGATTLAHWTMKEAASARQPHAAAGTAAVTSHRCGRGRAVLIGTWITPATVGPLVAWLVEVLGWKATVSAPPEVTVVRRSAPGRSYLFLLNHSPCVQTVEALAGGFDLIAQRRVGQRCVLPPYGVAVLQEK